MTQSTIHANDCRCSKCPGVVRSRQRHSLPHNPFRLTLGLALLGAVIAGTMVMNAAVAS